MGCTRHDKMTWIDLISENVTFHDISRYLQQAKQRLFLCLCRSDTDSLLHPEGARCASCKLMEFFRFFSSVKSAQLWDAAEISAFLGVAHLSWSPSPSTKIVFLVQETVRTCQLLSPLLEKILHGDVLANDENLLPFTASYHWFLMRKCTRKLWMVEVRVKKGCTESSGNYSFELQTVPAQMLKVSHDHLACWWRSNNMAIWEFRAQNWARGQTTQKTFGSKNSKTLCTQEVTHVWRLPHLRNTNKTSS